MKSEEKAFDISSPAFHDDSPWPNMSLALALSRRDQGGFWSGLKPFCDFRLRIPGLKAGVNVRTSYFTIPLAIFGLSGFTESFRSFG